MAVFITTSIRARLTFTIFRLLKSSVNSGALFSDSTIVAKNESHKEFNSVFTKNPIPEYITYPT